jgi:hypothetical protein
MGKLVANIHMSSQKVEGRMMLRWVLGHLHGKSMELLRIALEMSFGISTVES